MKRRIPRCRHLHALGLLFALSAGAQTPPVAPRDAAPATRAAQQAVQQSLPFANRADFDDARYGFVGTLPDATIAGSGPRPVFSMKPFEFLNGEAPATVNPSLWRQAQLNAIHGLFKVTDRMYQVRSFDIANMTIVEGDTSLIIIDPLTAHRDGARRARSVLPVPAEEAGRHGDLFARPCPTTTAASRASRATPTWPRARSRSWPRTASWKPQWPRTSSPATR